MLLAIFNGARYLQQQLDSIGRQAGVEIVLHVADDGSDDGSLNIVDAFKTWPVRIRRSAERHGATGNFLRLMAFVADEMEPDEWIAFCDQDDIWHDDKLERAVTTLSAVSNSRPLAYAAATILVDESNRTLGRSKNVLRPCTFANALVQCVAGANTLVLNASAARLVADAATPVAFSHDWLCYQLVTGAGGQYLYDDQPCLRYRQHDRNVVGSNRGLRAKWTRVSQLLAGDFGGWNGRNLKVLAGVQNRLTPESRQILDAFRLARSAASPTARLSAFFASGVYRQSRWQTVALAMTCLIGRM